MLKNRKLLAGLAALIVLGCCFIGLLGRNSGTSTSLPSVAASSQPTGTRQAPIPSTKPETGAPVRAAPPDVSPTPIPPTSTPIPPAPTSQPQALTGTGQQAAGPVTLNPGLVVAQMSHQGSGNFAVTVLDDQGQPVDLLANAIGSFDGGKAFQVEEGGSFVLDIAADGAWSVTLSQPGPPADLAGPPQSLSGHGQQATQFFGLTAGLATFTMTHQGQGNFAIVLVDPAGRPVDLLVNEIGAFEGSKASGIASPGAYLLDITADGDWTVTIEQ
jgi:hypothetical protein